VLGGVLDEPAVAARSGGDGERGSDSLKPQIAQISQIDFSF
jgi:hypothetical protein